MRLGILSTANINQKVLPGAQESPDVELVAVASRNDATAAAYAHEWGIPTAHGTYEALLEDPDVDAIYISLPNSLHVDWSIRALELIRDGEIGEPVYVRASFCFTFAQDRRAQGDHRLEPEQEGGGLMDVGCYAVNAARYLFGAEPVEVSAQQRLDPRHGVDTAFAGVLRFPGDRLALIDGSFDASGTQRYEVAGPKGVIQVDRAYLPGNGPVTITVATGGQRRTVEVDGVDQYALEADHFAASVKAGRLLPPAEDGVAQAAVIEALYESAETKRAIAL